MEGLDTASESDFCKTWAFSSDSRERVNQDDCSRHGPFGARRQAVKDERKGVVNVNASGISGADLNGSSTQQSNGNHFELSSLRLSQNFAGQIGVKKALITVPVRKPHRQWFVRTHRDPAYRCEVAILEVKEDQESYLVDPALWPELPGEAVPKLLVTAINRQGVLFLWPARLPDPKGRRGADGWCPAPRHGNALCRDPAPRGHRVDRGIAVAARSRPRR